MMNCAEASESLADHLYQELPRQQRTEVQEHLEACPECAAQHKQMQAVLGWLDRAEVPAPTSSSPIPVLVRQATEFRRVARRWRWSAVGCGAVAAAVLLAVTLIHEIRWEQGELVIRLGGAARVAGQPVPSPSAGAVPLDQRLLAAEARITRLQQSVEQFSAQHGRLVAAMEQAIQNASTPEQEGAPFVLAEVLADLADTGYSNFEPYGAQ